METIRKYLPMFGVVTSIVSLFIGGTYMYFRLEYVIAAVNPETIKQFAVDSAVLETKREVRWCLGKLVLLDAYTKKQILECAD